MAETGGWWATLHELQDTYVCAFFRRLRMRAVWWWVALVTVTVHTWTKPGNIRLSVTSPSPWVHQWKQPRFCYTIITRSVESSWQARGSGLYLQPQLWGRVSWADLFGSGLGIMVMLHLKRGRGRGAILLLYIWRFTAYRSTSHMQMFKIYTDIEY